MSKYEILNFIFAIAILLNSINILTMNRTVKKFNRRLDNLESRISALLKDNERKRVTNKELFMKRKCNNPKFEVIVCCQGQPSYYQYRTLIGALFGYAKNYLEKKKYGTMNFSLKQVF